jgi:tRNA(Ile)-lysidine synthase
MDQTWCEDASNLDKAYTRNRVRHEVLPLLRSFNPSLDETLAHMATLARDEESHWQAEVSRLLPQLLLPGRPVRGGGRAVATLPGADGISFEVERLRGFDQALRRRLIRGAAQRLGCNLTTDQTERLMAMCGFSQHPNVSAQAGATLELSGFLRARRSPRELRLSRDYQ